MVVSWPKRIKPDRRMRSQFHHVVDIAPTIYEILHIPHPKMVNGHEQLPMDGTSLAYTFDNPDRGNSQKIPILRQQRQPGDLSGRLDGMHHRAIHTLGHPGLRKTHRQLRFGQRPMGVV